MRETDDNQINIHDPNRNFKIGWDGMDTGTQNSVGHPIGQYLSHCAAIVLILLCKCADEKHQSNILSKYIVIHCTYQDPDLETLLLEYLY